MLGPWDALIADDSRRSARRRLEAAAKMSLVDGSRGRHRPAIARHLHRRRAEQGIDVLLDGRPTEPGVLPQPLGNRDRVDAGGPPPCRLPLF
jgi:hypothetical protein